MSKIQCPNCKAVNQDVEPTDPCWQCGVVLDRLSEAQTALETPPDIGTPILARIKTIDERVPTPAVSRPKPLEVKTKTSGTPSRALVIVILAIVLVIIAVAAFLIKGR